MARAIHEHRMPLQEASAINIKTKLFRLVQEHRSILYTSSNFNRCLLSIPQPIAPPCSNLSNQAPYKATVDSLKEVHKQLLALHSEWLASNNPAIIVFEIDELTTSCDAEDERVTVCRDAARGRDLAPQGQ